MTAMDEPLWRSKAGHQVDWPDQQGRVPVTVGSADGYTMNTLSPRQAQRMGLALITAASLGRRVRKDNAKREARQTLREQACMNEHGGHDVDWKTAPFKCKRCGSTKVTTTQASTSMPEWLRSQQERRAAPMLDPRRFFSGRAGG